MFVKSLGDNLDYSVATFILVDKFLARIYDAFDKYGGLGLFAVFTNGGIAHRIKIVVSETANRLDDIVYR